MEQNHTAVRQPLFARPPNAEVSLGRWRMNFHRSVVARYEGGSSMRERDYLERRLAEELSLAANATHHRAAAAHDALAAAYACELARLTGAPPSSVALREQSGEAGGIQE